MKRSFRNYYMENLLSRYLPSSIIIIAAVFAMILNIISKYYFFQYSISFVIFTTSPYLLLFFLRNVSTMSLANQLFTLLVVLVICVPGIVGDSQQIFAHYTGTYKPDSFDALGHIIISIIQFIFAFLLWINSNRQ
jgi:hypothetical protein